MTSLDVKDEFLRAWEGNRRLTLRVARAFPEGKLMTYAPTEPLRPFGAMLDEIARMEQAYVRGLAEDEWSWDPNDPPRATNAAGAIAFLEEVRAYTLQVWERISTDTLLTVRNDPFFFGSSRRPYDWLFYCLENEIHHRGQAYIYLRHLGVQPPPFWER